MSRDVNTAYLKAGASVSVRVRAEPLNQADETVATRLNWRLNCINARIELSLHGMNILGRYLQLLALSVLPLAILLELTEALGRSFGISEMLLMLVFGVIAFWLGRLIEGYTTKSG